MPSVPRGEEQYDSARPVLNALETRLFLLLTVGDRPGEIAGDYRG